MKFRLAYQGNDMRLGAGEHLIGRSPECTLCLHDPLVSRQHALLRVFDDHVTLLDLGSRNGVRINGGELQGERVVQPGDVLRIGGVDMTLVTGTSPRANATTAQGERAEPHELLSLLGGLADKALALGNTTEAERILKYQLEHLLTQAQAGHRPEDRVAEAAVGYASELACLAGGGRWLSYIFELCTALQRHAPEEVVERLYASAKDMRDSKLHALGDYIALHRSQPGPMTPRQRFVLGRAEGLLRLLQR